MASARATLVPAASGSAKSGAAVPTDAVVLCVAIGGDATPEGRRWSGSPAPEGPLLSWTVHADVAQLVEHHLAKVRVAGSNPVVRSKR
jgi:hypothetical protein